MKKNVKIILTFIYFKNDNWLQFFFENIFLKEILMIEIIKLCIIRLKIFFNLFVYVPYHKIHSHMYRHYYRYHTIKSVTSEDA